MKHNTMADKKSKKQTKAHLRSFLVTMRSAIHGSQHKNNRHTTTDTGTTQGRNKDDDLQHQPVKKGRDDYLMIQEERKQSAARFQDNGAMGASIVVIEDTAIEDYDDGMTPQVRLEESCIKMESIEARTLRQALVYYGRGDNHLAFQLFEQAAAGGNVEAMCHAGSCLCDGRGVARDYKRGVRFFKLAFDHGHAGAMYNLGVCYYHGRGVERNKEGARRLWQLAALRGHALASKNLDNFDTIAANLDAFDTIASDVDPDSDRICHGKHEIVQPSREQVRKGRKTATPYELSVDPFGKKTLEKAKRCYGMKDYDSAFQLFQHALDRGDLNARYYIGKCFYYGLGVIRDWEQAVRFFQMASDNGHAGALSYLGYCYQNEYGVQKNMEKAAELYMLALDKDEGETRAIFNLAALYDTGQGVEQDKEEAARLYRTAANKGHPRASFYLGTLYATGQGVNLDMNEAVRWYIKAAHQGDADATYHLGNCYQNGNGVNQNIDAAVQLYRQAANQGNARALTCLGVCYEKGRSVRQNIEEAVRLYREAAERGDMHAITNLGYCYQHGRGVAQSREEAIRYYKRAADKKESRALFNLGVLYLFGRGIDQDIGQGVKLHEAAAKQGSARALSNLAFFHLTGFGVPRDVEKAKELCSEALSTGKDDGHALLLLADILASSFSLIDLDEAEDAISRIPAGSEYEKFGLWLLSFVKEQKRRLAFRSFMCSNPLTVDNIQDAAIRPVALIGRGHFAKVYLCWFNDRWVAVKYLSVDLIKNEEEVVKNIMNERMICRMVKTHDVVGVVGYTGLVEDLHHQHRGLVFELHANIQAVETKAKKILEREFIVAQDANWDELEDFTNFVVTSLREAVVFPKGQKPSPKVVVRIMRDVAVSVSGLHGIGVIHRDIADRNVLCNGAPQYNVKVADFGLSKFVGIPETEDAMAVYEQTSHAEAAVYPAAFMAPEVVVAKNAIYSAESDVWSFGMLVYQCVSGSDPYEEITGRNDQPYKQNQLDLVAAILDGRKPDLNRVRDSTPEDLVLLIRSCWATDPEERPLMSTVVERLGKIMEGSFKRCRPSIRRTKDIEVKWDDVLKRKYQSLNFTDEELYSSRRRQRDALGGIATYTDELLRQQLADVGHDMAPSVALDKWMLRKLGVDHGRPCDVFIVHTGSEKKEYASVMKSHFEPKGFRCFLDQASISAIEGAPPLQMQFALETCRYAVIIVSKAFLEKDDPCEELQYAYKRMEWIRENYGWESSWIILLDLSVEEYRAHRQTRRPSLPDITKQHKLYLYDQGNSKYYDSPFLYDCLKSDLVKSDKEKAAVEKWQRFLVNCHASSDFPRANMLYQSSPHHETAKGQGCLRENWS